MVSYAHSVSALLLHSVTGKSNFGLVLADDEMFSFVIRTELGFFISNDDAALVFSPP